MYLYLARWALRDDDPAGPVFAPNIPDQYRWAALDLRGSDEARGPRAHEGARPWALVATPTRITERSPGRILLGDSARDRSAAARRLITRRTGLRIPNDTRDLGEIFLDIMLDEADDADGARPNRLRPTRRYGTVPRLGIRLLNETLASMPVPSSLSAAYSDDFNRANSTGLGSNWTKTSSDPGTLDIVSNGIEPSQTDVIYYGYNAGQADGDNQYAEIELGTISGAMQAAPSVRMLNDQSNSSGYIAWFRGTNQQTKLRYTNTAADPSRTDIASSPNVTYSVGDIGRLEVDGSDLELFLDGVSELQTTSTQYPGSSTRRSGGIFAYHTDFRADNWAFGDLGGPTEPGAPTLDSVVVDSETEATLNWTAPASDGGLPLTQYRVRWRPIGGSWSSQNTGSLATTFQITGLSPGVRYEFDVRARNALGAGTPSNVLEARMHGPEEVSDNFNRANGSLGTNWTDQVDGGESWTIDSNRAEAAGTNITSTYTGATLTDDDAQWAEVKIVGWTSATTWREFGAAVRMRDDAGDRSGYMLYAAPATSTGTDNFRIAINRIGTNGSRVTISAYETGLGDLRGSKIAIAVDGDELRAYLDGVELENIRSTDTNIAASTARESAGIWSYNQSPDETLLDNFRAGTGAYPGTVAETTPEVTGTVELETDQTATAEHVAETTGDISADTDHTSFYGRLTEATATLNVDTDQAATVVGPIHDRAGTLEADTDQTAATEHIVETAGTIEADASNYAAPPTSEHNTSGDITATAGNTAAVLHSWVRDIDRSAIILGDEPSAAYRQVVGSAGRYETRIELLDDLEQVLFTTAPTLGSETARRWGATTPSIDYARDRTLQRSAVFDVPYTDDVVGKLPTALSSPLDPRSANRIRVWAGYRRPDGDQEIYALATLSPERVIAVEENGVVTLRIEAVDSLAPLDSAFNTAFTITAGTNVVSAVLSIVEEVISPDGPTPISAASTNWTTPRIDVEEGDSRRQLVDQLLDAIGYEISADEYGRVTIGPIEGVEIPDDEAPQWIYGPGGITVDQTRQEWIGVGLPAGVRVIGGSISEDADPIEITLWDSDPQSLTYYDPASSNGQAETLRFDNEFVLSEQQGIEAGYAQLRRRGRGGQEVTFYATPNPALRQHDVISYSNPTLGITSGLFRVEELSQPVRLDGLMTVSARRSWAIYGPDGPPNGSDNPTPGGNDPVYTPSILDDFNRPSEDLQDSGNWFEIGWSWNVVANSYVTQAIATQWCFGGYASPLETTNHYAEADVVNVMLAGSQEAVGPMIRSDGQFNGYAAIARPGDVVELVRFQNKQVAATLGQHSHGSTLIGKTIRVDADGDTIRALVDGTPVITATDSSAPNGTYVGIVGWGRYLPPDFEDSPGLDNFAAGSIT